MTAAMEFEATIMTCRAFCREAMVRPKSTVRHAPIHPRSDHSDSCSARGFSPFGYCFVRKDSAMDRGATRHGSVYFHPRNPGKRADPDIHPRSYGRDFHVHRRYRRKLMRLVDRLPIPNANCAASKQTRHVVSELKWHGQMLRPYRKGMVGAVMARKAWESPEMG